MNTDIGLGLEKWMAVHKPYEWINEDLRQAVVKHMANAVSYTHLTLPTNREV